MTGVRLFGTTKFVTGERLFGTTKFVTGERLFGTTKFVTGVRLFGITKLVTGVRLFGTTKFVTGVRRFRTTNFVKGVRLFGTTNFVTGVRLFGTIKFVTGVRLFGAAKFVTGQYRSWAKCFGGGPNLAERNKKLAHIHNSLHNYWGGGGSGPPGPSPSYGSAGVRLFGTIKFVTGSEYAKSLLGQISSFPLFRARDPRGSLVASVALPLRFTAHSSLIFWSEEKEETARSLVSI